MECRNLLDSGGDAVRVIVGCEFSQVVTKAFRDRGHEAYSCDTLPTEGNPAWHLQRDIFEVIGHEEFDLAIFHPPCTRLCNSGVRWLDERDMWDEMRRSAIFFRRLLGADIPRICVENPIPHHYALEIIGRKYDQIIQPWQFGHPETKATCLWLKNLPPLAPTKIVEGRTARVHRASPGPDRWKERSRTYEGLAQAMAEQWGSLSPLTPQRKEE
jgi:hypothetical protein